MNVREYLPWDAAQLEESESFVSVPETHIEGKTLNLWTIKNLGYDHDIRENLLVFRPEAQHGDTESN